MNFLNQRKKTTILLSRLLNNDSSIINEDNLSLEGVTGYRSTLATHGVQSGMFYFEIQITSQTGHVRVGFSKCNCELYGPIGMDEHGFSYGSKNGYKFHQSKRKKYGPTYGFKDIIGVKIDLGGNLVLKEFNKNLYSFQNQEAGGYKYIKFYKNGEDLGIAYENLSPGVYFPAVSLYYGGAVSFNFGPYFAFPLKY